MVQADGEQEWDSINRDSLDSEQNLVSAHC